MTSQVSRREFVGMAAAAVGAAALGVQAREVAARESRRQSRYLLAAKWGMIGGGGTVLEKFELLKRLGYDGVELDSPGMPPVQEILEAKAATGIRVPGVVDSAHWSKPLSDPDAEVRAEGRRALEQAIRDCRAVGGTSVLLVPAVVNRQVRYADAYARSQEEIRKVLPLAEELDITIAIENVWNNFLLSPLEAARYVDELSKGPARVAWHFDVGNVVTYGWPQDWVRTLGRRIVKLDIKEFSRKKRDAEGLWKGFAVEIGEGDCDWPEVRAALDEIGYQERPGGPWACAEVGGGDEARLADVLARMRKVLGMMQGG